ncbi:FAD-linked oxidoreductase [Acrasis kona]|uniref:D-lactate dehydrogenase (cytochrome) n=1 Tax=Acrasis kona TaxID=1008807 RepID=A0AAW2ZDH9_9EUKA
MIPAKRLGTLTSRALVKFIALKSLDSNRKFFYSTNDRITPQYSRTPILDNRKRPCQQSINSFIQTLSKNFSADKISVSESVLTHHATAGITYHAPKLPDVVVYPECTEDVSLILSLCHEHGIPVIPYGAGTSLEGQITPVYGGVSIDTIRMNRVVKFNQEDMDITVQCGVTREQLNEYVRDSGLFFPIDPGANATIGGMTSTRASGTNAVRYGTMRDSVVNLTVCLPNGKIIKTARRSRKSSAGYDLTRLFVGSEGTLGMICEVTVRLFGIPEAISAARCTFKNVASAASATMDLIQLGVPVARVEVMDSLCVRAVNSYNKTNFEESPTLFFEFHGTNNSVQEHAKLAQEACLEHGGSYFEWTSDPSERALMWRARHAAYFASLALRPGSKGFITDVCVPISRLSECIEESKKDFDKTGLLYTLLGHVGDGNFHIIVMLEDGNEEMKKLAEEANERLVSRALSMEGTVTGEHGIGLGKVPYMLYEHGPDSVRVMRALKVAMDPNNIMNPGKVFPTDEQIDAFESSPVESRNLKKHLVEYESSKAPLEV